MQNITIYYNISIYYNKLLFFSIFDSGLCGMLPGDDVTVYGVMYQRWKPFNDGSPCIVELVLRANNIEVYNQHGAATSVIKDAQKEFEDFWADYTHDPIEGK